MVKVENYLVKVGAVASNILRRMRREAGDTLIEVTMALSILSMVLISSTVIAAQSFRLGQTARERTTVSTAAQAQMESVRAFRDNNTWDHFLHGTPGYRGMLSAASATGCSDTTVNCMHMVAGANPTFTPVDGTMTGPVPTSLIEVVAVPGANPDILDVTVNYWFESLSGGKAVGHIKTSFSNLKTGPAPTPPPVVLPPPVAGPLPVYLSCDQAADEVYFINLWDYQGKDWHVNYTQKGRTPHPTSTISYLQYIPQGNYAYWAVAKDAAGANAQMLHYLFYGIDNPTIGVTPLLGQTLDTPDIPTPGKQASISGTITFASDVRSIMLEHATKTLSTDDGVDSACLAFRPLP